jgi:hypothetical protein
MLKTHFVIKFEISIRILEILKRKIGNSNKTREFPFSK